jgi:hypothetical protein
VVFQINILKTILDITVPVKISMTFVDELVKLTYKRNELSLLNVVLSNGRLKILIDNNYRNTEKCLDNLKDEINVKKFRVFANNIDWSDNVAANYFIFIAMYDESMRYLKELSKIIDISQYKDFIISKYIEEDEEDNAEKFSKYFKL